jgi:hypothetical protein
MAQYSGYGKNIKLHSADKLAVHHAEKRPVVILECEVHGTILATGVAYHNRPVSIITLHHHHWRQKDHALDRLHGLSSSMERVDGALSLLLFSQLTI